MNMWVSRKFDRLVDEMTNNLKNDTSRYKIMMGNSGYAHDNNERLDSKNPTLLQALNGAKEMNMRSD